MKPFYLAPELVNSSALKSHLSDSKASVWSCGVILHVMLTGQPPFYASPNSQESTSFLEIMKNKGRRLKTMFKTLVKAGKKAPRDTESTADSLEVLFPDEIWSHVSASAKLITQRMLSVDPDKRPSLQQLKQDKWFTDKTPATAELGRQAIHKRITEFRVCSVFELSERLQTAKDSHKLPHFVLFAEERERKTSHSVQTAGRER